MGVCLQNDVIMLFLVFKNIVIECIENVFLTDPPVGRVEL